MPQRLRTALFLLLVALYTVAAPTANATDTLPVTVTHAQHVGDGTAFLCTFAGKNLVSVTASFLNRSITAEALPGDTAAPAIKLLLPVPLDHPGGLTQITWAARFANGSTAGGASPITIVKRTYPVQKLTVAPKFVTPDPSLKERLARERKLMGAALNTRSKGRQWELPLLRPVPGKITSLYGLRRVFNDQPRNPHKGLDFRAAQGEPIAAVEDGTVVLTGDFYYAGKFVVLDHGLGLVSASLHLSEISVQKGQRVKRGDRIGLAGSTGRVTGPHLHLSVSVLGQSVDALPLIAQTQEDRAAYAKAIKNASQERKKPAAQGSGKDKRERAKQAKTTAPKPARHSGRTPATQP